MTHNSTQILDTQTARAYSKAGRSCGAEQAEHELSLTLNATPSGRQVGISAPQSSPPEKAKIKVLQRKIAEPRVSIASQ